MHLRWIFVCCLVAVNLRITTSARYLALELNNTQQFADAVADWGSTGEDTVLLLPRGRVFSLANVTIKDAQPQPGATAFSSGTLTIKPGPGTSTSPTLLDTAMLAGMNSYQGIPTPLSNMAQLVIEDLTLVNLCEVAQSFVGDDNNTFGWYSALGPPRFITGNIVYQGMTFINVTFYVREADVGAWTASVIAGGLSPFPQLVAASKSTSPLLRYALHLQAAYATSLSVSVLYAFTPGWLGVNVTFLWSSNPTDPVLQSLESSGILQSPQICYLGPSTTSLLPLYIEPLAPLFFALDVATFMNALVLGITSYSKPTATGLPLTVFIGGGIVLGDQLSTPAVPALNTSLLIWGRASVYASPSADGVLDTTGYTQPILVVAPTGQLYLQSVRHRGLPTSPLPSSGTPSAFPLGAFTLNSSTQTIQAYNLTLELPDLDYLAFMTIAQPSFAATLNATVTSHIAALQAGITELQIQDTSNIPFSLQLAFFQGWGLNITFLTVQPATDQLLVSLLRSQLFSTMNVTSGVRTAAGSEDQKEKWLSRASGVAAIVSSVIGGVLVGAMAMWAAIRVHTGRSRTWTVSDRQSAMGVDVLGKAMAFLPGVSSVRDDKPSMTVVSTEGSGSEDKAQPLPDSCACTKVATSGSGTAVFPSSCCEHPQEPAEYRHYVYQGQVRDSTNENRANSSTEVMDDNTRVVSDAVAPRHDVVLQARDTSTDHSAVQSFAAASICTAAQTSSQLQQQDVENLEEFVSNGGVITTQRVVLTGGLQRDGEGNVAVVFTPRLENEDTASGISTASIAQINNIQQDQRVRVATPDTVRFTKIGDDSVCRTAEALDSHSHTRAGGTDPTKMVHQLAEKISGNTNKVDVTGVLGQGSWGRVYSGRWRGLDVAIKTMTFEMLDEGNGEGPNSETKHQRAVMEAAVSTSVDHDNLVRTYFFDIKKIETAGDQASVGLQIEDVSRSQGRRLLSYKLFLIQERCSLSLDVLFNQGAFSNSSERAAFALLVLLDIASGLNYLHSRGIVHGDLKPANVLLYAVPDAPYKFIAKLADFGLSARLGADATHVSNFRSGTPFYVAPEVVHEHRTSPASDVFSLGVIMWQLHTGLLPYLVSNTGHFSWNPFFPQFPADNRNHPYESLLIRCLQREPKDRPTTQQVIQQLQVISLQASRACAATNCHNLGNVVITLGPAESTEGPFTTDWSTGE